MKQVCPYYEPFPRPCALLSAGETTVTVRAAGRGGRNSKFLLALALELRGQQEVWALAVDTDGIDGSEDNAGAVIGPGYFNNISIPETKGLLERNNSYALFKHTDSLLVTGPTHTNVNDLRIILIP